MSVRAEVPALVVERVLASVAELQCEARPGTVRQLARLTSLEPDTVSAALAALVDAGAVARTDAGGVTQYRLPADRWPFA